MTGTVILDTERLILRELEPNDLDFLASMMADPEVSAAAINVKSFKRIVRSRFTLRTTAATRLRCRRATLIASYS